jgi:galactose-1-phosphate uridylyltransferase
MVRVRKGMWMWCLALALANSASGQEKPPLLENSILGPLLSNSDVQKELKLSEEQINKLKDVLGKVMERYKDDFVKFQRMSPEEQQKKMVAFLEDNNKAIAGVLDAKQWKRFKQIQWQMSGIAALQDRDLQKELKLSDEQKKKLDGIFNEANKKMQEMMKNGERSPEKYQTLFKDVEKKAHEVLSEEQQKHLKEAKGPPFQFSFPKSGR